MEEPIFANNFDDEPVTPLTSDTPAPTPGDTHTSEVSGPEPLLNAQVYLAHGDRFEIAKVIGRKRNSDGLFIGRKHSNPILDSRVFIVEFPDGEQKDVSYNLIAEHLFSQVDSKGNQYRLFKEIINHRVKITVENTCDFLQTPVLRKYTGCLVHRTSTIGKQVL
jgi:hypothetical protein